MNIQAPTTAVLNWSGDLIAFGFFTESDAVVWPAELAELPQAWDGILPELIHDAKFQGKAGTSLTVRLSPKSPVKKIMLVGLGAASDFTLETLRRAAATVVKSARKDHDKTVGLYVPIYDNDPTQALAEGIHLGLHQDLRFKSDPEAKENLAFPESIDLLGPGVVQEALPIAAIRAEGVILARELVNAPANVITPVTLAEKAQAIASTYGLESEILEQADCEALGMGAYLGVAQASDLPPKFIHLTYRPQGTATRKLAIIGKGLTFDSGGLNLKVSGSGIETMKMDMAGSAAVLGAAQVIAQLKPSAEVHFIVAATENMISGKAMHPGDILTAANGKTIEINNTDAEGRLTLADALIFAEKLGVDAIVDLATLTGACIVALGESIAGLWATDQPLADHLLTAANQAGEKFWQMPMEEKYFEGMKSPIADMKNTGPRAGGSITAALFLKQFIQSTPWAHLDIAGPVWVEKEDGYLNPGGTGFGVQTLVNWVLAS
ncbi:leucyl aminopeptidase [Synechococcus sp. PCC 6312]|uniref:leucyl aminopeptidase n=1 Tax=Synechococcus sp. (strain ATCC 27167 / PCC 6312) TaxID=195253 RepID=UPI00029F4828|nr:leucyl aminopeptidase [Synechococcus sp. PCC 6312]AFY60605.1 leucyl aminopeptidase [Synechococcus sp. PCC 6312]